MYSITNNVLFRGEHHPSSQTEVILFQRRAGWNVSKHSPAGYCPEKRTPSVGANLFCMRRYHTSLQHGHPWGVLTQNRSAKPICPYTPLHSMCPYLASPPNRHGGPAQLTDILYLNWCLSPQQAARNHLIHLHVQPARRHCGSLWRRSMCNPGASGINRPPVCPAHTTCVACHGTSPGGQRRHSSPASSCRRCFVCKTCRAARQ